MRKATKLSILIVDDYFLSRVGLRQILSGEYREVVFGEAATAAEALTQIRAQLWHLVILAISLPDEDGISVLREIRSRSPNIPVLVLSSHADSYHHARYLKLGASCHVSKHCSRSDLLKAVKNVLVDGLHFNQSAPAGTEIPKSVGLHTNLSNQEYRVLLAVAAGKRTGGVAVELNLSAKTVSTYKRRALNKLGITSTAELVRYVIENRLT
jgi:two-component system invasion response regulator UvrY